MSLSEFAEMTFWEYIPAAALSRSRSEALNFMPILGSGRILANEL